YVGLITLNFGSKKTFDAIGYYSGNLEGFPQAADVYVSDDGVNWTLVPSASYNAAAMAKDNKTLINIGQSVTDLWPGYNNVANAS
ncbi:discoidin domain-containing protein, partial [Acinetobacter baumannii]